MDKPLSTHRTDEQLLETMDETGDWVVNNGSGLIQGGVAATLRQAIAAATDQIADGEDVPAVSRLPPDGIIVFRDQLDRLISAMAERPIV